MRVLLAIAVKVSWKAESGEQAEEEAETEEVNAHGALLRLKTRHRIPAKLHLTCPQTKQSAQAQPVWIDSSAPDRSIRIAVALATPSETPWGIRIPALSS